ncbi:MAG: FAH family protein [Gammaproteobacteria bacterium]|nr:FAH family protein [Gammaproteobacteria bacterium]
MTARLRYVHLQPGTTVAPPTALRLVQYLHEDGVRRVAIAKDRQTLLPIAVTDSVYGLAHRAVAEGKTLAALAEELATDGADDYQAAIASGRVLVPLDHPVDPAHCLVSGTGLTHIGIGAARQERLAQLRGPAPAHEPATSALQRSALAGGQPQWFYKGDGDALIATGEDVAHPAFGSDLSDEADIAALFIIDAQGRVWRVGYALANAFTDHVLDQQNPLLTGHAKLRACALGPELLTGGLPATVRGMARIQRAGQTLWKTAFICGQDALTHPIDELIAQHFKYRQFRRPGDVHVHLLGAAAQSFAAGIRTQADDCFAVESPDFGLALTNRRVNVAHAAITIYPL